jgi:hypothetical protein
MRKSSVWVGLALAMIIPLITRMGSRVGESSGIRMRYLNVEWLGYGFTFVFGVEDLRADYAELTKELLERDDQ